MAVPIALAHNGSAPDRPAAATSHIGLQGGRLEANGGRTPRRAGGPLGGEGGPPARKRGGRAPPGRRPRGGPPTKGVVPPRPWSVPSPRGGFRPPPRPPRPTGGGGARARASRSISSVTTM